MSYEEEDTYLRVHSLADAADTCMSYEEEDTCMSYEEEDTCMSHEEEDTYLRVHSLADAAREPLPLYYYTP